MNKKITKLFSAFFTLTMLTATATAQVNTSRYIDLKVAQGDTIQLTFAADAEETPVRIVSGATDTIISVDDFFDYGSFRAQADTMRVYGNLAQFGCSDNATSVIGIDATKNTGLTKIECFGSSVTYLKVSGLSLLKEIWSFGTSLDSLDVSGLTELELLYCNHSSLTYLNVSGSGLVELDCQNNSLTSLDLSGLTNLTNLRIHNNHFSTASLDFIYCSLFDRSDLPQVVSIYPIEEPASANYATVLATNKANATAKNWAVKYASNNTDIPATTGSYVCGTVGLENVNRDMLSANIYPNPATTTLTVETEEILKAIEIFDMFGKRLVTQANAGSNTTLDIQNLKRGVYILRLQTATGTTTHRIIKN